MNWNSAQEILFMKNTCYKKSVHYNDGTDGWSITCNMIY